MTDDELMAAIRAETDPGCVVAPAEARGRQVSSLGHQVPDTPILRPASTEQVVSCIRLCGAAGRALIPLGGGTNYAGSTAATERGEWFLSLERMNRIESVDADNRIAVVQAGVVLQNIQEAAREHGAQFAVDLGGRGSATIGGMIATNAGGERVFRYGMMREQIIGLEAVLADGRVIDLMDRVIKNNAGYDIKQWFIGTEGTLGVVTRAVLRLRTAPSSVQTALLALPSVDDAPKLLNRIEAALGGTLSAFELLWPEFYDVMCGGTPPQHRPPVRLGAGAYVLMEAEGGDPGRDAERFEAMLEALLEDGLIDDAAIAQSHAEREAIWQIRNDIPHFRDQCRPLISLDVSVPLLQMPAFARELRTTLAEHFPDSRSYVFGHAADNNLHIAVNWGPDTRKHTHEISGCVYEMVMRLHGSISAEHGIGIEKREALARHKQPGALALMREMKGLLDPNGVLNPGKVVA